MCRGHHRAIGVGREVETMHGLCGNHQHTGRPHLHAGVVDARLHPALGEQQDLDERLMGVGLDLPVVGHGALRDPLEIQDGLPAWQGLVAIQRVVRDNPCHGVRLLR